MKLLDRFGEKGRRKDGFVLGGEVVKKHINVGAYRLSFTLCTRVLQCTVVNDRNNYE